MNFQMTWVGSMMLMVVPLSGSASASSITIGTDGINSDGLTLVGGGALTGSGIGIGQVELERPGKRVADGGFDNAANSNTTANPANVFVRTTGGAGIANMNTSEHAQQVAGVMISNDVTDPDGAGPLSAPTGVATGADLYSSATNPVGPDFDSEAAITTQHVATQNGGDIRAINMSFQNGIIPGNSPDGNQLYTQFIDWSATEHDVLYVAAGKNSTSAASLGIPTDNFNGVTVGRSIKVGSTYRGVSTGNDFTLDATGDRSSIDLIAPGDGIDVTGLANLHATQSGASFAAPHVTGTVALLQEFGDERISNAGAPQWTANARRHEVMKAVLMNSADKIEDTTGTTGKYLGMDRTVLKKDGTSTWFDSDAYLGTPSLFHTEIPLDEEMGAGHLNAKRALQQFVPGEQEVNGHFGTPIVGDVPVIGWDYGTIEGPNFPINKYALDETLVAGNFISITLAWDREVEFDVDNGTTDEYDIGDTFETYTDLDDVLTNLDLYLVPAGTNDIGEFDVGLSDSTVTPVEHIFQEIPFDGDYEIWVFRNEQFAPAQDYGIAWWYGLAPDLDPPTLPGDFDNDNDVDGADFLAWQRDNNVGSLSDWENNFGSTSPAVAGAGVVPEPATWVLLLMATVGLAFVQHRAFRSF